MSTRSHRSVYRAGRPSRYTEQLHRSYERTDGRTNGDLWLRTRDHLTFRNARAHIPDSSQPRRSSDTSRRAAIADRPRTPTDRSEPIPARAERADRSKA